MDFFYTQSSGKCECCLDHSDNLIEHYFESLHNDMTLFCKDCAIDIWRFGADIVFNNERFDTRWTFAHVEACDNNEGFTWGEENT